MEIDWSINGGFNPNSCAQAGAASIRVDITDASGSFLGTYASPCQNFATSITLSIGNYGAAATLVDLNGNARTTTVNIPPFSIYSGTYLRFPVDFPANSFF